MNANPLHQDYRKGVFDPRTGKIQWQDMTQEEALESDKKFSETFEEDFTRKGLRAALIKNGLKSPEQK